MAKELAMVERNDKGRQARQYFIECERRLKQQSAPAIPSPIESDLRGVAFIADSMRLPESGKLDMFTRYCQANAPQLLPALPDYAIDKPSDSQGDSSKPTLPISKIVDGITSAKRANLALHAAGLLEQRFREKAMVVKNHSGLSLRLVKNTAKTLYRQAIPARHSRIGTLASLTKL